MKVLRILSELDFGGVEQVALNSFSTLNEQVTLQVLVLNKGGKVSKKLEEKGVSIKILNVNSRIPNFKLIKLIRKEIQSIQPDVVHSQGAEANFHGVLAASFDKVPRIIAEEIGIPNHHSLWKWVFRWVYSKAHQIIAISEAVKKEIVRLDEVKEEKVEVIYNPVDLGNRTIDFDPRNEGRNDGGQFVFVTTCRLVPIKNLDRLIQAFAALIEVKPDRQILLRIVGEGPERESLEFRIQNLELGEKVEILGFQSIIWSFLEESDVFVLPSLREGSSVSLVEAMTVGLPSVVTKVGGASEVLGKSQSGILIDPLSTSQIQNAMQSFLDLSIDERKGMGLRAREEAKRFSVDNYIDSLMSVYGLSEFRLKPSDL